MAAYAVLTVAALICQASAQFCNGPSNIGLTLLQPVQQISELSTVVSNTLPLSNGISYSPFMNPTPVIPTTFVDNSVANSLANTLQLLIISDLLSLNPATYGSPIASNIVPLYDAIGTIGTSVSPLEVISPDVDITSVNYSPIDVTTVVTDVVTAAPIVEVTQAPVATNYVTEVVSPVPTYFQSNYVPTAEVAPFPFTSTVNNIYGPFLQGQVPFATEVTSSIAPIPSVGVYTPCNDVNTVSVTNTLNPYYVQPPSYVTEVTEIVSPIQVTPIAEYPYLKLPSPLTFAPIEVAAPVSFVSDCFAGYPDVVASVPSPIPIPVEIILPQSIPAQIRCNFGYSPVNIPFLSVNVEPVSPCNGFCF